MKGEDNESKRDLPDRTFEFARRVVKLCQCLDQTPGVSRTLANQLLRSGTSIGANVEEGDREVFLLALRNVAEANGGMSAVAAKANLGRESLYRMLSRRGNPEIKSLFNLLHTMGLRLAVKAEDDKSKAV